MRNTWYIFFLCFFCSSLRAQLHYDASYHGYSTQNQQPHGILVVAYNRPFYFKFLLDSLEKNAESQTMPFFFFLDGGIGGTQEQNIDLINKSNIKTKIIVLRESNYGCPKNHIDSKRFMFDWCGFDKVIVLEEDLIVSSTYIRTMLSLHHWAKHTVSNIAVVQGWTECFLPLPTKKELFQLVRETDPFYSLVTYCIDKEAWNAISPMLYEYEHRFIDPLIGEKDSALARSKPATGIYSQQIKDWVVDKILTHSFEIQMQNLSHSGLPLFKSKYDLREIIQSGRWCVSQDWLTSFSIFLAGFARIQTLVNRVVHIGEEGITSNSDFWRALQHDKMVLDEFMEGEEYFFENASSIVLKK